MKTAAAIRHVAFEDLAGFAPALDAAGFATTYFDTGSDDLAAPALAEADLLVVLGGPIGAYQDEIYPFLHAEVDLITRRLADDQPTMGICLGAQLIARAAGARVYPSGVKEIGFGPISLTEAGADSCLAPFAEEPLTLHWHGDTFDLPEGAVHLASTDVCENQAFAIGSNIVGFQFHPEAMPRHIENWLIGHAAELAAAGADVTAMRKTAALQADALERKAHAVMASWLDQIQVS